jgi:hypothetical protein
MPFNIQNFKQNLADYGYLHGNRFELLISSPPALFSQLINNQGTAGDNNQLARTMKFRIDQVAVPSINIIAKTQPRFIEGTAQDFPISIQFEKLNFNIILDEFGELWQYWNQWIKLVYDGVGTDSAAVGFANQPPTFNATYKDDMSSVAQIVVYDFFGNAVQKINFYEAFPTAIQSVNLNWGDERLIKLGVTMSYSYYTMVGSNLQPRAQTGQQQQRAASQLGNRTTITP